MGKISINFKAIGLVLLSLGFLAGVMCLNYGCTAVNAGKVFNWLAPDDKEPDVTIIIPAEEDENWPS